MSSSLRCPTHSVLCHIEASLESSLGVVGLGNTSASCVHGYRDQVGCVLILMAVGRGCLTWILGSRHSSQARLRRPCPHAQTRACVGYSPVPSNHNKNILCQTRPYEGHSTCATLKQKAS